MLHSTTFCYIPYILLHSATSGAFCSILHNSDKLFYILHSGTFIFYFLFFAIFWYVPLHCARSRYLCYILLRAECSALKEAWRRLRASFDTVFADAIFCVNSFSLANEAELFQCVAKNTASQSRVCLSHFL